MRFKPVTAWILAVPVILPALYLIAAVIGGQLDTSKNRCFFYWKTKGSLMFVVFDPH